MQCGNPISGVNGLIFHSQCLLIAVKSDNKIVDLKWTCGWRSGAVEKSFRVAPIGRHDIAEF